MTRIYGMEKRRRRKAGKRARTRPAAVPCLFSLDAPHYLVPSIAAPCLSAPLTYIPSYQTELKERNVFPSRSVMEYRREHSEAIEYVRCN